jgi:hypothetical protein
MQKIMVKKTIELDCEPMSPRPDSYIDEVLEGTGLTAEEPISKSFGNWTWEFSVSDEKWNELVPLLKARISALYYSGRIRYGSW